MHCMDHCFYTATVYPAYNKCLLTPDVHWYAYVQTSQLTVVNHVNVRRSLVC
jgi:hypothetical protein